MRRTRSVCLFVCLCLSFVAICLSFCWSVCLFVRRCEYFVSASIDGSVSQSLLVFDCLPVCLSVCLFVAVSPSPLVRACLFTSVKSGSLIFDCLSVRLFLCLFWYLVVCLSVRRCESYAPGTGRPVCFCEICRHGWVGLSVSFDILLSVCEGSAPAITVLAIMGHARPVCLSLCYLIICQSVRHCEGFAPASTGGSRTVSLSVSGILLSVYKHQVTL